MARMSLDDSFLRDPRVRHLGKLCGWSRRETMGALLDVWAVCYDRATPTLNRHDIDIAAELEGFAEKMIETGLGHPEKGGRGGGWNGGVRVSGAATRVEYLARSKAAGTTGGLKSADVRRALAKPLRGSSQTLQGSTNPSVTATAPDTASASVSPSVSPSAPDSETERERVKTAGAGAPGASPRPARIRKPQGVTLTEPEAAAVAGLLDKLGRESGVSYRGSDPHKRLIAARLRDGIAEDDLRKVIVYCAHETGLGWKDDPKMAKFLRPDTLFGSLTIERYLDPARAWFDKNVGAS